MSKVAIVKWLTDAGAVLLGQGGLWAVLGIAGMVVAAILLWRRS